MQNLWSSTVKQIIYANILQLACGVLAGFYSLVAVASFAAGSASGVASGGLMSLIFDFGAIGGFIWYFVKVIKFSQIQGDDQDTAAIDKLKIAILISLVAAQPTNPNANVAAPLVIPSCEISFNCFSGNVT